MKGRLKNMKDKTLTFKEFLTSTTGYKNVNDLIRKNARKSTPPYTLQLAIENIEEEYLKYCNEKNKKFNPKWH